MPDFPEKSKRKGKPRSTRLLLFSMLLFWLMILGVMTALLVQAQGMKAGSFRATTTSIAATNAEVIRFITETAEAMTRK
jgi:hypothetical protein